MGQFDLNLSTRPFPAYRFKTLMLTIGLIALGAISVWQVHGFRQYSRLASQIRGDAETAQVEAELAARRLQEMESKLSRPEATAKLNEIAFLNDIIARKSFSWTQIFANLEQIMPDAVHVVSLNPDFSRAPEVMLNINVRGRSMADIKDLIEELQSSPSFGPVEVDRETKKESSAGNIPTPVPSGDIEVTLKVPYRQERDQ